MKEIYFHDEGVKECSFEYVLEKYTGLIKSRVSRWLSKAEYDDLFQEASIAVWMAYEAYDSEKEISFGYFADRIIRNFLYNFAYKRNKKYSSHVSQVLSLVSLDEIENYACSGSELDNEVVERIVLQEAISRMNDREKMTAFYTAQGYNQGEIGKKMNVSQATISRINKKLTKTINEMYLVG